MELIDPRTGAVRGTRLPAREAEVAGAVAAARSARAGWAALTPRERQRRLGALAELVERHADDYVAAECAGTGKPAAEAAGEVAEVADLFRFYGARRGPRPRHALRLPGRAPELGALGAGGRGGGRGAVELPAADGSTGAARRPWRRATRCC